MIKIETYAGLFSAVLVLLLNSHLCHAVWPHFASPSGWTSPEAAPCFQAFTDAIILARHTALFFDPCAAQYDPLFLRYFRPEHARFVGNMFRAIANIPYDLTLTTDQIRLLLTQSLPQIGDKYSALSIFCVGDHPYLVQNYEAVENGCNSAQRPDAYTLAEGINGEDGYMSMCPKLFLDPTLHDIEYPPDWARDSSQPSVFMPGYGCGKLGNTDSSWMISTGATVLHELFHWEGLFNDVPDYYNIIPSSDGDSGIEDIREGAFLSNQVNLQATSPENAPTNNADNYVFYALTKYYAMKCGRMFQAAPSQADADKKRDPPPFPFPFPPPQPPSA